MIDVRIITSFSHRIVSDDVKHEFFNAVIGGFSDAFARRVATERIASLMLRLRAQSCQFQTIPAGSLK
jgi:hypothetical protein